MRACEGCGGAYPSRSALRAVPEAPIPAARAARGSQPAPADRGGEAALPSRALHPVRPQGQNRFQLKLVQKLNNTVLLGWANARNREDLSQRAGRQVAALGDEPDGVAWRKQNPSDPVDRGASHRLQERVAYGPVRPCNKDSCSARN